MIDVIITQFISIVEHQPIGSFYPNIDAIGICEATASLGSVRVNLANGSSLLMIALKLLIIVYFPAILADIEAILKNYC